MAGPDYFRFDSHDSVDVLPKKVAPLEIPIDGKEAISKSTAMDLDSLRASITPNVEMARAIEASSDPVGGIHGLKLILSKTNHYKGKIDGSLDEEKKSRPSTQAKINPIVKGLIDFQIGYNSPFELGDDGKPVKLSGTSLDMKQGIPRDEIGKLGPVTLTILLDYAKRAGLELPPAKGDKKFESGVEFQQKYGPVIDYLTSSLRLPKNLILGIAKQESNLGTNPADYWGGNGVLQLTTAPLADMSGVTQKPGVTDWRKIGIYQGLYKKVDADELKSLPFGNVMKTLESSLDSDAWDVVDSLCGDATSPKDFRDAMQKVRSWERGKFRGLTYHTLNILVGSVYLAYIQDYRLKGSQNVSRIAELYNGSGHKEQYAQSVTQHVARFGSRSRRQVPPIMPTRLVQDSAQGTQRG